MLTRAVVHIGTAKTGTSYLQRWFQENPDFLDLHSIVYPKCFKSPAGAHHELAKRINTEYERKIPFLGKPLTPASLLSEEDIWTSLLQETKPCTSAIVLSSEAFSILSKPEDIKRLKNSLVNYDTEIVVYIRHIVDQLEASYAQGVKANTMKRHATFTQFIMNPGLIENNLTNRLRLINNWASVFGPDNVTVRPYAREHMVNGDIVSDFMEHTAILGKSEKGMEHSIFPKRNQSNISLTSFKTEILRRLNKSIFFDNMTDRDRDKFIIQLSKAKFNEPKNVKFFPRSLAEHTIDTFGRRELALVKEYLPSHASYFTSLSDTTYIDDLPEQEQILYMSRIEEAYQGYLEKIYDIKVAK